MKKLMKWRKFLKITSKPKLHPNKMTVTKLIEFPTLQSKDGTMVVSFYPVVDSTRFTLQVLTWKGIDTISTKLRTNRDAQREIQDRLNHDYLLTGDNINSPQTYHIAAC